MIIPIASDHAGYDAKEAAKKAIEKLGYMPIDFGTHSPESVDYPEFAVQVAKKVNAGEHDFGVLICGSGQGMCMTANKYPNVRAALVYSMDVASMSRKHNNANIICLPGKELNSDQIEAVLKVFFSTSFDGGRHERRVEKIQTLTEKQSI